MAATRTHLVLGLTVSLLTYGRFAAAQPIPDSEEAQADAAKALTKAGFADYTAGRFADAAAKFSEAYKTYPKSELLLNLSRTEKHLAQCDKALEYAQRYLKTVTGSDPSLEQAGQDELAHLRAECPEVQVISNPPGALVWIETDSGPSVGTTPWVGRLLVGRHAFILKSAGLPDSRQTVELVAGSTPTFNFDLAPAVAVETPLAPAPVVALPPPPPPAAAKVAAPPPPPEFTALPQEHAAPPTEQPVVRAPQRLDENHPPVQHHMSTLRTAGWAATVVGALALTTAIILGANVQSETNGLHSSNHPGGAQAQSIINDTQTKAAAANALYVIGGVSAAAGVGLVIFF